MNAPVRLGKNPLPLKYSADRPSASVHKDTRKPSRLTDGRYAQAARQSVQYDGDVVLTIDLGSVLAVGKVHVVAFHRRGDFEVASVAISLSDDAKTWASAGVIANDRLGKSAGEDAPVQLTSALSGKARYVRLTVKKGAESKRVVS